MVAVHMWYCSFPQRQIQVQVTYWCNNFISSVFQQCRVSDLNASCSRPTTTEEAQQTHTPVILSFTEVIRSTERTLVTCKRPEGIIIKVRTCGDKGRLSLFVLYLKKLHPLLDAKNITTNMLIKRNLTNAQLSLVSCV